MLPCIGFASRRCRKRERERNREREREREIERVSQACCGLLTRYISLCVRMYDLSPPCFPHTEEAPTLVEVLHIKPADTLYLLHLHFAFSWVNL